MSNSQDRAKKVNQIRLQRDIKAFQTENIQQLVNFKLINNNIDHWQITFKGPKDTPYEDQNYTLDFHMEDYPYSAPRVYFVTKIFHPNVALDSGNICLDILQDKWAASIDMICLLEAIISLLDDPNVSSPLNRDAARLWSNKEEFKRMVRQIYNNQ